MQLLVDVGRNDPCPCGSGRKFKKCCLDAKQDALKGRAGELDVVRAVDVVVELDDWSMLEPVIDRAMELFARGEPLEHVRFRRDLVLPAEPSASNLAGLCSAGWLQRCDLEMSRVLDDYELSTQDRDALRLAMHLLRRFGARAPIVEEVVQLQLREQGAQLRRLDAALAADGLDTVTVLDEGMDLVGWIERVRPAVLTFAGWFALLFMSVERRDEVWASGIASRICDACLDRLEAPELDDRREWGQLASIAMFSAMPELGKVLMLLTPLLAPTPDELLIHEAVFKRRERPELGGAIMTRIVLATERRGDYLGAALLREALRAIQMRHR
jgi:hypothetical protein